MTPQTLTIISGVLLIAVLFFAGVLIRSKNK